MTVTADGVNAWGSITSEGTEEVTIASGAVTGKVESVNGAVAGATVKFTLGEDTYSTVTDDEGIYTFSSIPAGNGYTVTVSMTGYMEAVRTGLDVVENEINEVSPIYLVLDRYNINIKQPDNGGGMLSCDDSWAYYGTLITVRIISEYGYRLKEGSLRYNDGTRDIPINGTSFIMPAANVTITADFEEVYWVRIEDMVTGGSIIASPNPAAAGETISLTITPDPGMQLKEGSLKYNDGTGDHVIEGNSFTMPAVSVTVMAEFEKISKTYMVSIDDTITGGTIAASKDTATEGEIITLTITPDTGKRLKAGSLKYNDGVEDHTINISDDEISFEMPGADVIVTGEFEEVYTVNIGSITGGTITATPTVAAAGETITLTITPDPGMRLTDGSLMYNDGTESWYITGTSFAMPAANVTVTAEFEEIPPTTYTVSIGTISGGSIIAFPTTAVAGKTISLIIIPDTGMQLKAGSLKYNDGTGDHEIEGTSFTMPAANVTVTAEFEVIPPTVYEVRIGTLSGGSIIASPTTAVAGETISLTITPDTGMQLKAGSLKYNDGTEDHEIEGTSFTMPAANVTVTAEFEEIQPTTYTVSIGTLSGGSIIASPTTAVEGETISLAITPDTGKRLKAGSLKYNDGTGEYEISGTSFTMPAADVTVTAEFEDEQVPVSDLDKVMADIAALNIGYATGDSEIAVTQNVKLTVTGAVYGSAITWTSSNTAVISNSGVVTRPTLQAEMPPLL